MSQLEEWLLVLVAGLGVYSIVVTVAWWRDSRAKFLTGMKKRDEFKTRLWSES